MFSHRIERASIKWIVFSLQSVSTTAVVLDETGSRVGDIWYLVEVLQNDHEVMSRDDAKQTLLVVPFLYDRYSVEVAILEDFHDVGDA